MEQVHRQPVLVGGRYLKLKRGVSQSPWLLAGRQAVIEESVEVRSESRMHGSGVEPWSVKVNRHNCWTHARPNVSNRLPACNMHCELRSMHAGMLLLNPSSGVESEDKESALLDCSEHS
jgi:hypothetical protein